MDLPPLPFLPSSQEDRLRLLWWGKQIAQEAAERERKRCAVLCDLERWSWGEERQFSKIAQDCAAAIRGAPGETK